MKTVLMDGRYMANTTPLSVKLDELDQIEVVEYSPEDSIISGTRYAVKAESLKGVFDYAFEEDCLGNYQVRLDSLLAATLQAVIQLSKKVEELESGGKAKTKTKGKKQADVVEATVDDTVEDTAVGEENKDS